MAAKFLIAAAVPFNTARLQAGLNLNVVRKMKEIKKNERMSRDTTDSDGSSRRMHTITAEERMHLRYIRNQARVQMFQENAKEQEKLLKQHVSHLRYEKKELLLKNEVLRMQNTVLEVENECLKFQVQALHNLSLDKRNSMETAFKRVLSINIHQQKEVILPKVVLLLLMSIWESVKQNVLIVNDWIPYVDMQLSLNSSFKYLLELGFLPWKLMIPLASHNHNPLIING